MGRVAPFPNLEPGELSPSELEPGRLRLREVARALRTEEDAARLLGLARSWLGRAVARPPAAEGFAPSAVERLLEAPDSEIDISRGALLIAREDRRIDIARVLGELDWLGAKLRARLAGLRGRSPTARLATLSAFVFDELGFRADLSVEPRARLDALHLDRVLERRRGHCLGLSVLYLSLAARADLPLFGVSCPGHFFVRWDDGVGTRRNVETTYRGASFPDGYYAERYRLSEKQIENGIYLENLARREVLVEVLNNRANVSWDMGDAARASRDIDRVARVSKNFARGLAGRGFLALQRGHVAQALADLLRAVELDPAFARAQNDLGDALLRSGRLAEAEQAFGRASELDPRAALPRTNLGRVKARRGEFEAAILAHQEALVLDPRSHVAWNNLGTARHHAGDLEGARAAFKKALRLAPRFHSAQQNLALVERSAGHPVRAALATRAALRGYRERLLRTPGDEALHAGLARFLVESQGDLALAHEHAERACVLAPDSPRAWEALALVARQEKDWPRAVRLLERAIALGPSRAGGDEARLRGLLEDCRRFRGLAAPESPAEPA